MKSFWIKTVNLLLVAGVLFGYNTVIADREQTEEISRLQCELEIVQQANKDEQSANKADYTDGVYTGSANGFGGVIEVEAEIKDGVIETLTIVSAEHEDKAYLDAARKVIDDIVEQQTADVDTVSGATFSSSGIRDVAAKALEKAEKK